MEADDSPGGEGNLQREWPTFYRIINLDAVAKSLGYGFQPPPTPPPIFGGVKGMRISTLFSILTTSQKVGRDLLPLPLGEGPG